MKIRMAIILSVLALCGLSQGQTGQRNEEEIVRFVNRYDDAWNHKKTAVIENMLAPDYVYFSSKGDVRPRQSLLDELLSPKYSLASAERSEMKVYQMSGTAVVSSRWKGYGTYDGQEFHDDQRCSIVIALEEPGWRVLSEHCTQIAAH